MIDSRAPHIVVGTDASSASLRAMSWALGEGAVRDLAVEVVHCWRRDTSASVSFTSVDELHNWSICMLQYELAAALTSMQRRPEVILISVHGRPVSTLLARSAGASMLVVGAHGHSNTLSSTYGHVATHCRRNARCPVVVVDGNRIDRTDLPSPRVDSAAR